MAAPSVNRDRGYHRIVYLCGDRSETWSSSLIWFSVPSHLLSLSLASRTGCSPPRSSENPSPRVQREGLVVGQVGPMFTGSPGGMWCWCHSPTLAASDSGLPMSSR